MREKLKYNKLGTLLIIIVIILFVIDIKTKLYKNKIKQDVKIISEIPLTEILVNGKWIPFTILEESCKCST